MPSKSEKKAARERSAKTGESYTTALKHVLNSEQCKCANCGTEFTIEHFKGERVETGLNESRLCFVCHLWGWSPKFSYGLAVEDMFRGGKRTDPPSDEKELDPALLKVLFDMEPGGALDPCVFGHSGADRRRIRKSVERLLNKGLVKYAIYPDSGESSPELFITSKGTKVAMDSDWYAFEGRPGPNWGVD